MYEDLTNILPFNPNLNDAMSDSEYEKNENRISGLTGMTAQGSLHNKLFAQCSAVAHAIARFVAVKGFEAFDYDAEGLGDNFRKALYAVIEESTSELVPDTRTPNHPYGVGDIVHDPNMPLWGELECIESGITSSGTLGGTRVNAIGQKIQDGTVIWALRASGLSMSFDVPEPFTGSFKTVGLADNEIRYYVPIHPEIALPMVDCRLCDGQDLSAYGLGKTADMRGRCLRGASEAPDKNTGETLTKGDSSAFNSYGGRDSFTVSKSNLPVENIPASVGLSFSAAGGHSHSYTATKTYSAQMGTAVPVTREYVKTAMAGANTGVAGGHAHSGSVSGSFKMNDSQSSVAMIHPYYAVAYIQRIY